MLAMNSSEPGRTQTDAVNTFAIATACRVFTLRVWYITLLTFPTGVTDTLTCTVVAVTVTQRRTYA